MHNQRLNVQGQAEWKSLQIDHLHCHARVSNGDGLMFNDKDPGRTEKRETALEPCTNNQHARGELL
jgi:hypothetical protein